MKKTLRCSKGFTLIELMVVIIIVGILASISVPIYKQYVNKARASEGQALCGAVASAARVYLAENASLPASYTLTGGSEDTTLHVDPRQNRYFSGYALTTSGNGFTVATGGTGDASGISVTLSQPAAASPVITISGL